MVERHKKKKSGEFVDLSRQGSVKMKHITRNGRYDFADPAVGPDSNWGGRRYTMSVAGENLEVEVKGIKNMSELEITVYGRNNDIELDFMEPNEISRINVNFEYATFVETYEVETEESLSRRRQAEKNRKSKKEKVKQDYSSDSVDELDRLIEIASEMPSSLLISGREIRRSGKISKGDAEWLIENKEVIKAAIVASSMHDENIDISIPEDRYFHIDHAKDKLEYDASADVVNDVVSRYVSYFDSESRSPVHLTPGLTKDKILGKLKEKKRKEIESSNKFKQLDQPNDSEKNVSETKEIEEEINGTQQNTVKIKPKLMEKTTQIQSKDLAGDNNVKVVR